MAVILSIESSGPLCSTALHKEGKLLAIREANIPQAAASLLAVQVSELFAEAKRSLKDAQAVAVSGGPGSYTGLRIGVATAKGICYGSGIPLICINSLLVLASQVQAPSPTFLLCPMIDARRMEVYCSVLDASCQTIEETAARVITEGSFSEHLEKGPVLFFGSGAMKCRDLIRHRNAHFVDNIHLTAAAMGALAFQKFKQGDFEDLAAFEPAYLKDFVAKTKTT